MVKRETVYSFALLLVFLRAGNAISLGFDLHVPGSVIGMILNGLITALILPYILSLFL